MSGRAIFPQVVGVDVHSQHQAAGLGAGQVDWFEAGPHIPPAGALPPEDPHTQGTACELRLVRRGRWPLQPGVMALGPRRGSSLP
ncbi:MAG: hypothetical protein ACYCZN_15350, partial [Candidatus Dormibacteria bacterium]